MLGRFLLVACVWLAPAAVVAAAPVDDTPPGSLPEPAGPLVVVPVGCAAPTSAVVVFEGTVTATGVDSATFAVERVLSGDLSGRTPASGTAEVRYGDEVRFLDVGERYVVGAGSTTTGRLRSTVRPAAPLFGGDAVVGLDDADVDCPRIDDPVRTLMVDGTPVDSAVLAPLDGRGSELLGAIMRPALIALLVLLGLVVLKHGVVAAGRVVRDSLDAPLRR